MPILVRNFLFLFFPVYIIYHSHGLAFGSLLLVIFHTSLLASPPLFFALRECRLVRLYLSYANFVEGVGIRPLFLSLFLVFFASCYLICQKRQVQTIGARGSFIFSLHFLVLVLGLFYFFYFSCILGSPTLPFFSLEVFVY